MRIHLPAVLVLVASLGSAAQGVPPEYRLKEETPALGTNIPKNVVTAPLPLTKTYAELTSQERARLHALYPELKEGDEPPFPLRGLRPVMREIADLQARALVNGTARYGVRVDAKGIPQAIAVYKSPDERFTKAVAYQLINTDYKPAKCDGQPCAGEYIFDFEFKVSH